MPSIFVAYASADRAFAYQLGSDLRAAGIDLWLDQIDVKPGDIWEDEQARALADSDCVLVILTPAAVSSRAVTDDIHRALAAGKAMLPVLKAPCALPPEIRELKCADFTTDYSLALSGLRDSLTSGASRLFVMRPVPRRMIGIFLGLTGALYGAICQYALYARYVRTHGLPPSLLVQKSLSGALVAGAFWAVTGAVCGATVTALKWAFAAAATAGILWVLVYSRAYVDTLALGLVAMSPAAGLAAALLTRIGGAGSDS